MNNFFIVILIFFSSNSIAFGQIENVNIKKSISESISLFKLQYETFSFHDYYGSSYVYINKDSACMEFQHNNHFDFACGKLIQEKKMNRILIDTTLTNNLISKYYSNVNNHLWKYSLTWYSLPHFKIKLNKIVLYRKNQRLILKKQ